MIKKLNKKGFTLVELLAVIVVLAIIMVIATQAIGNVIQQNTVNAFESSLNMVAKQAKQAYVLKSGNPTIDDVRALVEYDPSEFTIDFGSTSVGSGITEEYVCIVSVTGGRFNNMDTSLFINSDNTKKAGYENWFVTKYTDGTVKTTACKKFR